MIYSKIHELFLRSNRLEGGEPLHNTSVYLAAKPNQQQFLDDWNSILNIAGACVIKKISVNSGMFNECMKLLEVLMYMYSSFAFAASVFFCPLGIIKPFSPKLT